ncbi:hypothetical protein D3C86_1259310 [compost metagenome]
MRLFIRARAVVRGLRTTPPCVMLCHALPVHFRKVLRRAASPPAALAESPL